MLLLQKIHGSNIGVYYFIVDLIVDWKRFLIDRIDGCKLGCGFEPDGTRIFRAGTWRGARSWRL